MLATFDKMLSAFDADQPLEHAHTIPAEWYTHPDLLAAERERAFATTWLAVGRADQVARPGDYFTALVVGEPLLVVRDAAGVLRAFFNVCRHRAALVACGPQGHASRFRCRYHGWTYELDGRLRGTPEFDGVADFQREDNGLVPIQAATWGPFVWIHLGGNPLALDQVLAPLQAVCQPLGIESVRFVARQEYELRCNWKVFVDNYLDGGYHVNTIHPGLAGVLDYQHYRTEIHPWSSVQISPLTSKARAEHPPGIGQVRTGDAAYYWWVFPNFMLNLYQGVLDTNIVWPLGPDRCRVVFDFYFTDTEGEAAKQFMAESMAVAHQIQVEDMGICEDVQQGMASRSYAAGRFSVRREVGVYHFHQLLARKLRGL
jgi:choline monooxygenase